MKIGGIIFSTIFLTATVGWQMMLYFQVSVLCVAFLAPYYISIIFWVAPLIYYEYPWWFNLYIAQTLFLQVSLDNAKESYAEGKLDLYESQDAYLFAENICMIPFIISVGAGIYSLF